MKKILTLLLTFFVLFSYGQNEHFIDSVFATSKRYKDRFIPDGGTMLSDRLTKAYMLMAEKHGIADNIEFGWMSGGASKKRVDGINQFYTNLYDFYGTNDATQTTASNQPYVSGNIAPNEVESLKNPNGSGRYMTHPEISFSDTDEWSVTTVLNWNGDDKACYYMANLDVNVTYISKIYLSAGDFNFYFRNQAGTSSYQFTNFDTKKIIGKNVLITFIADGGGNLSLYVNGVFQQTISATTDFTLNAFGGIGQVRDRDTDISISSNIIRSQALTPEQVAAEHALLRDIYPEIPSVKIGEQEWATSNLEMVATPQGNVIANVTETANVEKVTGGDFESGLIGNKGDGLGSVSTWTLNTTTPISGTQDGLLEVTTGASNRPIVYWGITHQVGQWVKFSFDYKITQNTCGINQIYGGPSNLSLNNDGAVHTFEIYYKVTAKLNSYGSALYLSTVAGTKIQIDNVSIQEVGWSGLGDLYNELIARGYTDYDAYKEVAAWCYYNNDPSIGATYGKLYNWYAAKLLDLDMASSNYGWRVPTQTDFETLATTLGGANVAGGKMKVPGTDYWTTDNGTNISGWSGLGVGYRDNAGLFTQMRNRSIYWTNQSTVRAYLYNDNTYGVLSGLPNMYGTTIRLIKE